MVEEIITALSRFQWPLVIARTSSFAYKSRTVDVKQVSRELGVRYVLEGCAVRKAGNRVRITGQLIDATTGAHLWADRFEGSLENVFELQDQVASGVVGAIDPKLREAEMARSKRKPPANLDASDMRPWPPVDADDGWSSWTRSPRNKKVAYALQDDFVSLIAQSNLEANDAPVRFRLRFPLLQNNSLKVEFISRAYRARHS